MRKMFDIIDPKDGSNVLGGSVPEDNAYVQVYPAPLPGEKPVADLAVGESSTCKYSLGGTSGVYRVVRVS